MTIILVSFLSSFIGLYIREIVEAWDVFSGQKTMALSSRAAMNRIVREIKRINQNTNILTHASAEVTFIDVGNNTVTFLQSGTNLMRNSNVLLSDLQNPGGLTFSYLDEDGNPTAITNQMRLVRCRIITVKEENRYVIESAARIRIKRLK
ncbi:MAG: hypothetical protein JW782_01715 [Candidatus Saganbacteria bacterium]|nr:hypothetical protein [Candidatus Saganbacteria bacterium]